MNKNDILNIPEGREMDVLIAEMVFNCNYKRVGSGEVYCMDKVPPLNYPKHGDWDYCELLHYSTNISDAWEIIEHKKGCSDFSFVWHHRAMAIFDKLNQEDEELGDWVGADTAPLAICRAALLAFVDLDDD